MRMILVMYYSNSIHSDSIDFSYLESHLGVVFEHDQSTWVPFPRKPEKISINKSKYANKKIVFLARDPRDILVSSWYHLTYREKIYKDPLSEFIKDPLLGIKKIVVFMNRWLDAKELFHELLIVRYEDLKQNPELVIVKILNLIGETNIDKHKLQTAIQNASLDNMRKMESDGKFKIPWLKPGNKKDKRSFKTRKGMIGDWKNHFSESDIEYTNQILSKLLSPEFGYEKNNR
ncbi:sulfotransferase domain-containing protein [bacterium]|nr:sulfotransferase domain-containing protein [bacterium]